MLSSHVFIVFSLLSEYDGSFLLLSYRWAYYCCYYCTIFHRDSYQFEKFILHFSISFPDLSFPVLKFSGSLPNLSILNGFHSLFSGYGLIRFYRVGSIKREFYWGGGGANGCVFIDPNWAMSLWWWGLRVVRENNRSSADFVARRAAAGQWLLGRIDDTSVLLPNEPLCRPIDSRRPISVHLEDPLDWLKIHSSV